MKTGFLLLSLALAFSRAFSLPPSPSLFLSPLLSLEPALFIIFLQLFADSGKSVHDVSKGAGGRAAELHESMHLRHEMSLLLDRPGFAHGKHAPHIPSSLRRHSFGAAF